MILVRSDCSLRFDWVVVLAVEEEERILVVDLIVVVHPIVVAVGSVVGPMAGAVAVAWVAVRRIVDVREVKRDCIESVALDCKLKCGQSVDFDHHRIGMIHDAVEEVVGSRLMEQYKIAGETCNFAGRGL